MSKRPVIVFAGHSLLNRLEAYSIMKLRVCMWANMFVSYR